MAVVAARPGRVARALRLFHTLRQLRWPQLSGQVLRAMRGPVRGPGWSAWQASPLGTGARWRPETFAASRVAAWQVIDAAGPRHHGLDDLRARRFRFLGTERTFADAVEWRTTEPHYLWGYNLNYFEFLEAARGAATTSSAPEAAAAFVALAEDWLRTSDGLPHRGREPYPTSLRLVEWCKTIAVLGATLPADTLDRLANAAAWHAETVYGHLETHLLGNHLLENARALLLAAASIAHPRAAVWESTARRLLDAELREQILPDGAHYERSPMYHGLMQRLVLDALAVTPDGHPQHELLSTTATAMAAWQSAHLAPDGDIACANDAQRGIAPDPAALGVATRALGAQAPSPDAARPALAWSAAGGYATIRRGPWHVLFDAGAAGPSYQAGHAHCDALSVQVWRAGRPLFIDPGVDSYVDDAWRRYARSTAAHNTVQVDGREQSEAWAAFRMGRQVSVLGMTAGDAAAGDVTWAWGAVRGYGSGAPRHDRWVLVAEDGWLVVDRVSGQFTEAVSRWHCAPDVTVEGGGPWTLRGPAGASVTQVTPVLGTPQKVVKGSPEPLMGWYFPSFGTRLPTSTLSLATSGAGSGVIGVTATDDAVTGAVTLAVLDDALSAVWRGRQWHLSRGRVGLAD